MISRVIVRDQRLYCTAHLRYLPKNEAECVVCRAERAERRAPRTATNERRETATLAAAERR